MRGIRRADKHEEIVRLLADEAHPESGRSIFPSMRELMCFAAMIGFEQNKSVPLEGKTLEVDPRIWRADDLALDLLYLIPLAAERTLDVLNPESEDRLLDVFEAYVNGGFTILRQWMNEVPDDAHGDRALLEALHKYGYLNAPKNIDDVIGDITF